MCVYIFCDPKVAVNFFIIILFRVFNQIKVYLCYVILLLFQTPMMWPIYICINNIKCLVNKKGAKRMNIAE